ncbi:serine hydrolase domain-containing protein [Phenylobacterium sp.]|uniref:serine hydrolase domain-containing protein n=1 Tax=Phenylobacterium sp. TaxID=1871053 RepID=UPI00301BF30B
MRFTFLAACALALAACSPTAISDIAMGAAPESVEALVQAERNRAQAPGISVAVVKDGELLFAQGYGLANVEHNVPATEHTIFQSGSIGKQFTAAAVLLLVEDGKLELDAPLSSYMPETPASWNDITIRRLLTHTAGLPDYAEDTVDLRRDYSDDELAQIIFAMPLISEPGTAWSYSNTAYALLGVLIHKVSGKHYLDVLKERVFTPTGMTTARGISEADIVLNRSAGYHSVDGILKNQDWVSPYFSSTADGALYLTALDLVAWDTAIREGAVLKPESWQEMFTPATFKDGSARGYGLGWFLDAPGGEPRQSHSGSWQGFTSAIARYPNRDLTVIVLANHAHAKPTTLAAAIARAVEPDLPEESLVWAK